LLITKYSSKWTEFECGTFLTPGQVFNVSSGIDRSVLEIAEDIIELTKAKQSPITFIGDRLGQVVRRISVGTTTMPVGAAKVSGNIGIIFLTSDDLTAKFTFCGIVPNTRKVFSGSREEETIATNSPRKHEPETNQLYFGQLKGTFHFSDQFQKSSDRPLDIHLGTENMFEPKPFSRQEKISIILKNRSRHVPSFGSL
jgi:hypothetical protein